jgi:uncharacterized coiled-coil protein SlyX
MPLNLNNLEEAQAFQEVFVKPLVDAIREEIRPVIVMNRRQEVRIKKLERNQRKALTGFAGIVALVSAAVTLTVEVAKEHFFGKH